MKITAVLHFTCKHEKILLNNAFKIGHCWLTEQISKLLLYGYFLTCSYHGQFNKNKKVPLKITHHEGHIVYLNLRMQNKFIIVSFLRKNKTRI